MNGSRDSLICPSCRGELDDVESGYRCAGCQRDYPIIAGIPDFRICADPYITIDADREKGLRLEAEAAHRSFADLLSYYYEITREVLPDLANRYRANQLSAASRGEAVLRRAGSYGLPLKSPILDLGCGTGGLLAAARAAGHASISGIDVAFRWLIVARSRLKETGADDIQLFCACADHLPFRDGSFDSVIAENLLEHVHDASAVLREAKRVRRVDGVFVARSVNRFAAGPEPHVGVWGVGMLPRRWMHPYVRWRKRTDYRHVHLRSFSELRTLVVKADPSLQVRSPRYDPGDYAHHPPGTRRLFSFWTAVSKSGTRPGPMALIAPHVDITSKGRSTAAEVEE